MADPVLQEPPLPILQPGPHFSPLAVNSTCPSSLSCGRPAHSPSVPHPPLVTSGCAGLLRFPYLGAQGPEDRGKAPVAVLCLRCAPAAFAHKPPVGSGHGPGSPVALCLPPLRKLRLLKACDSADRSRVGTEAPDP